MLAVLAILAILSSCTQRLVDYTVISSKNVGIQFDKAAGVQVEESVHYPYRIGLNLKEALDQALEKAGPEYDILVDGVVEMGSYNILVYWWSTVTVKGIAISSAELKLALGEEGFKDWLAGYKVTYNKTDEVINAELPEVPVAR